MYDIVSRHCDFPANDFKSNLHKKERVVHSDFVEFGRFMVIIVFIAVFNGFSLILKRIREVCSKN